MLILILMLLLVLILILILTLILNKTAEEDLGADAFNNDNDDNNIDTRK